MIYHFMSIVITNEKFEKRTILMKTSKIIQIRCYFPKIFTVLMKNMYPKESRWSRWSSSQFGTRCNFPWTHEHRQRPGMNNVWQMKKACLKNEINDDHSTIFNHIWFSTAHISKTIFNFTTSKNVFTMFPCIVGKM